MYRLTCPSRFALTLIALLGLTGPTLAQEQTRDMVRFKITVSGKVTQAFPIALDPPILAGVMTLKGTAEPADLLGGEVTLSDTHVLHLGVDGAPIRSTDGTAVFHGPGGDAFFVTWDAALRPTNSPNLIQGIAGFTGRGGRGKFAGVVSSGLFNSTVNMETLEVTQVWEGVIAVPKK